MSGDKEESGLVYFER